jgi:succinate-acetate transporter protein
MSQQQFTTDLRTDRSGAEPLAPVNAPPAAPEIADPGPLGLAGFAMTTFVLSVFNAGLLPATLTADVLGLALFYGGIAQLLAGMWEFRKGNTFGALAFSSFGAFWLSFWYYSTSVVPKLPAADAHNATGLYLLAWTIFTAYMTVASLRTTAAVAAVFVALTLTFLLLTIGEFGQASGIAKVGGYVGLLTAVLAWYASFAGVTNATYKRVVLPVRPLS